MTPEETRDRIQAIRRQVRGRLYLTLVDHDDGWTVTPKLAAEPTYAYPIVYRPATDPDADEGLATSHWLPRSAIETARILRRAHPGITIYMLHRGSWLWVGP